MRSEQVTRDPGARDRVVRDSAGFRLRGHQVTRTETFVDAAFAFSLTLPVIFHNDLPHTVAELRAALLRVAFVPCFAMLALFRAAHNRWSRRFGLDAKVRYQVRSELGSHALLAGCALLSLLLSAMVLALDPGDAFAGGLPMWVYAGLSVAMLACWARRERGRPSRRAEPA